MHRTRPPYTPGPVVVDISHSTGKYNIRNYRVMSDIKSISYCIMHAFLKNCPCGDKPETCLITVVDVITVAIDNGLMWRNSNGHLYAIRMSDLLEFISRKTINAMGHNLCTVNDAFGCLYFSIATACGCTDFKYIENLKDIYDCASDSGTSYYSDSSHDFSYNRCRIRFRCR